MDELDLYSSKELANLHQELEKRAILLDMENSMLQSHLGRVIRKDDDMVRDEQAGAQREIRREKKKKGDKLKEVGKPLLLTVEQKCDIATREIEELRDEIQNDKEEWAKIIDDCKAEVEEIEVRAEEIKKAMYEFKRDIAQQALNPRTGKIIAERVVRYYEDKIKQKDAVIEKLRLKNVTLKAYKNKLGLQLKQKEEMGEVLHAIDFDQLQIENKQYLLKIEERNAELLKLKMTASRTVQILNEFKKSLSLKTLESESIAADIMQRKDLLRKLQQEEVNVGRDLQHADKQNAWLKCQIQEYKVPDVSLIKIGDAVCNGQGFPL